MTRIPIERYDIVGGVQYWCLGDSEVLCTIHGKKRLEERDFTLQAILDILASPDLIRQYKGGKQKNMIQYVKNIDGIRYFITVARAGGRPVITTAFSR